MNIKFKQLGCERLNNAEEFEEIIYRDFSKKDNKII